MDKTLTFVQKLSKFCHTPNSSGAPTILMIKVDKGVVLGVAQTLGTGYFPAASARRASFFDPVSTPAALLLILQCSWSEVLPAVAYCNCWRTSTPIDIRRIIARQNRKGDAGYGADDTGSSREILSAESLSNAQYDH